MVCLGNICRSPLAEGILNSLVNPEEVEVDSAGTGGYHIGNPPDIRSIEVARRYGIDISAQRCRKIRREDFDVFDHILVMDRSNLASVIALAPNASARSKIRLLLEGAGLDSEEVPDPYYGEADGFEHVYQMISKGCLMIRETLITNPS